jgi:hypothetical protein
MTTLGRFYRFSVGTLPADMKELPPREATTWRKAQARAIKYSLGYGLLYRGMTSGNRRLCVLASLVDEILYDAHDAQSGGGHNGVEKTVDPVSTQFYWPRIFETVRRWTRRCSTCLRVKPKNQLPAGLLSPLPIPSSRTERINIDFITKLPMTTPGKDTIITIVDGLSKRIRWVATTEEDLTAERFAELFVEHYVPHRSIPVAIVSDHETRFTSKFWRHLTTLHGTKLRFSTAFHPQTDGLAEKANGTVQTFLRAYAVDNLQEWDRHLALAEFTYNATKYKITRVSPVEADISWVPRLPLDIIGHTTSRDTSHSDSGMESAESFAQMLRYQTRQVQERLEAAQADMVESANTTMHRTDKVILRTNVGQGIFRHYKFANRVCKCGKHFEKVTAPFCWAIPTR